MTHTELGNKEIHERHSVMVEGGLVPRAKVMDQAVIDKYLMKGSLTLAQHQAAELLLGQAAKAGLWAKSPDPDRPVGGEKSNVPLRIIPMANTLKLVSKKFGEYHAYLVQEVVCHDWDVSGSPDKMKALTDSLQHISNYRMSGGRNPIRHLKVAADD